MAPSQSHLPFVEQRRTDEEVGHEADEVEAVPAGCGQPSRQEQRNRDPHDAEVTPGSALVARCRLRPQGMPDRWPVVLSTGVSCVG